MNIIINGKICKIDKEDYDKAIPSHITGGYLVTTRKIDGRWVSIPMHRLILDVPPNKQIDHINRNKLDNRKNNLRICTTSQNHANKTKQKNNTSGYKGVDFLKSKNLWRAMIQVEGKRLFLGYYKTPEAAFDAYKSTAIDKFSEFASF